MKKKKKMRRYIILCISVNYYNTRQAARMRADESRRVTGIQGDPFIVDRRFSRSVSQQRFKMYTGDSSPNSPLPPPGQRFSPKKTVKWRCYYLRGDRI